MVKIINAKCPNCGANLELPAELDRAYCTYCGGKILIVRDEIHYHTYEAPEAVIGCPECFGRGYVFCRLCNGTGRCTGYYTYTIDRIPQVKYCINGTCPKCRGSIIDLLLVKCSYCQGTRRCPTCQGTGRCITCGGAGRFTCAACNGSGFKVYRGE